VSYKFVTNFKPLNYQAQTKKVKLNFMRKLVLDNSSKIIQKQFCKSIFVFICYFKFFEKNTISALKQENLFSVSISILPKIHKTTTLLRSSFVNKVSKKNYSIERYFFVLNFLFKNLSSKKQTLLGSIVFLNSILLFLSTFESNICFSQRVKISTPLNIIQMSLKCMYKNITLLPIR
jgi:hypothetical protein